MTVRERINALSDEELATELCNMVEATIEAVATNFNEDFSCEFCPVTNLCKRGHIGFKTLIASDYVPAEEGKKKPFWKV